MGAVAGLLLLSVFAVFDFQGRLSAAAAAAAAALGEQLLSNSNGHGLHKRSISTSTSTNCQEWQGFQRNLTAHTHKYEFLDLSGSVTLAWVGDGTGVLLALTTFQLPLLGVNFGQSRLYRRMLKNFT